MGPGWSNISSHPSKNGYHSTYTSACREAAGRPCRPAHSAVETHGHRLSHSGSEGLISLTPPSQHPPPANVLNGRTLASHSFSPKQTPWFAHCSRECADLLRHTLHTCVSTSPLEPRTPHLAWPCAPWFIFSPRNLWCILPKTSYDPSPPESLLSSISQHSNNEHTRHLFLGP